MSRLTEADRAFLLEAARLGERGLGRTWPNPAVGAVVAHGKRVVGRGFHRRAGGAHAEVFALREAGGQARRATIYVTLEPCTHTGRTGPCVEAILAAGCSRVVVGARDPNPAVDGRGIRRLRRAGLEVIVVRSPEPCRRLIEGFAKRMATGLPFVTLKLATTLDGQIATAGGESRWITGPAARRRVHEIRNRVDAILVGSGTVLADDPELTCRLRGGHDPLRVVLDGRGRVPASARVFRARGSGVRCYTHADPEVLSKRGIDVRRGGGDRHGALKRALRDLAADGVGTVLVEGGRQVASRALTEDLVDRVVWLTAPKIFGEDGLAVLGPLDVDRLSDAFVLVDLSVERLGPDLLIEGVPHRGGRPSVSLPNGVR